MSRYVGNSGGGSSRRPAPSYNTSSSSRNYSSSGASDRDYSRSHVQHGNGGSASYNSAYSTSRKPDTGAAGGYSYLEPNWIEKTRSSIPIDPYGSSYLDRAPLSTSRDYTTAAAAAQQPVYPSAAAAALSVGAYSSSMPKAYAPRADDYYRAPAATLAAPAAYGYSSAFEQSTMAAQAAAIYEMQNSSKRDSWQTPAQSHHTIDYGRRDEDRRAVERPRRERVEERRGGGGGVSESWRGDREREVPRDRDHRRPSLPSRERERDRDMRVPVAAQPVRRDASHREVRRADPPPPAASSATRGGRRDEHTRDRVVRDARDTSRRSIEKRAAVVDSRLDRESRELERQLAKVQRELEQLEGGGRSKERSSREKESDRSRRSAPSSSAPVARRSAAAGPPPARVSRVRAKPASPPPPRRTFPTRSHRDLPPPMTSSYAAPRRAPAVRPTAVGRFSRSSLGGRSARPSASLPSLMDALVPRPGRRSAPAARVSRVPAWEAPSRAGRAPAARRVPAYAGKRTTRGGGRADLTTLSSREKVRRAKEKMRREEERKRRVKEKRGRAKETKESREKRKEEDFAWLETIMSEDEELDEEANRKVLLAPRQRRVIALVDRAAVHPHTLENLEAKMDGEADAEPDLWTAEECEAIELLPIVDSSLKASVAAAFLDAHPEEAKKEENGENGKMEE